MSDDKIFDRWQNRIERGLTRLISSDRPLAGAGRYTEALEHSRSLGKLNAPAARLFNALAEISLRTGFSLLAIVLLRRAGRIAPGDPLLKLNISRAQLSLATRFLLRAPASGGAAYNLDDGRRQLEKLIASGKLPEATKTEATLLLRRIEDRREMWQDIRSGDLDASRIRELVAAEDREVRELRRKKIPTVEELEKYEPKRTGFYYREYREQQRAQGRRKR